MNELARTKQKGGANLNIEMLLANTTMQLRNMMCSIGICCHCALSTLFELWLKGAVVDTNVNIFQAKHQQHPEKLNMLPKTTLVPHVDTIRYNSMHSNTFQYTAYVLFDLCSIL